MLLWRQCIANSMGYTQFYDAFIIDLLPNCTRMCGDCARWPWCFMWYPIISKHSTMNTRVDLMDLHVLRILKLCKTEYNHSVLQVITFGAGTRINTTFLKYQNVRDRPKQFMEHNPYEFDIINTPVCESSIKDVLTESLWFVPNMPTLFIFDHVWCDLNTANKSDMVAQVMMDVSDICRSMPNSFMIVFDAIPAVNDQATIEEGEEYFNSIGFSADFLDWTPIPTQKASYILSRIPRLIE
eukprot:876608_1